MFSLDLLKFNMQLSAMPDPNALKSFKRFCITFTWIKSRPMSAHAHSHDDWLKWLLWNFSWVSGNWRKLNTEFLPAGLTPGIWFKLNHKMTLKQTSVLDDLKYIGFFFSRNLPFKFICDEHSELCTQILKFSDELQPSLQQSCCYIKKNTAQSKNKRVIWLQTKKLTKISC